MYEPVWHRPRSVDECLRALAEGEGRARLIAGGTDLAVRITGGTERPRELVDLGLLDELRALRVERERVIVGATVTHGTLSRAGELTAGAGVLAQACRSVGSPQIRSRGTIGGNVANASPAADGATALLALGAVARLRNAGGVDRVVALEEFWNGPGDCVLCADDLLTAIEFTRPPEGSRSVYLKAGQRNALAIAIVSVAAVHIPGEGVRIALGSVAPTPVRARAAERAFEESWDAAETRDEVIREVARKAVEASCCIDDVRASAVHRMRLVRVLTERALREIC